MNLGWFSFGFSGKSGRLFGAARFQFCIVISSLYVTLFLRVTPLKGKRCYKKILCLCGFEGCVTPFDHFFHIHPLFFYICTTENCKTFPCVGIYQKKVLQVLQITTSPYFMRVWSVTPFVTPMEKKCYIWQKVLHFCPKRILKPSSGSWLMVHTVFCCSFHFGIRSLKPS